MVFAFVKSFGALLFSSSIYCAIPVNGHDDVRSIQLLSPPPASDRMRVLDVLCQRVCTESPKCITRAEDVARGEYLLIALSQAGH